MTIYNPYVGQAVLYKAQYPGQILELNNHSIVCRLDAPINGVDEVVAPYAKFTSVAQIEAIQEVAKEYNSSLAESMARLKNIQLTYRQILANNTLLEQFRAYRVCHKLTLMSRFNINDPNEGIEILNGQRRVEFKECNICKCKLGISRFQLIKGATTNYRDSVCSKCRNKRNIERRIEMANQLAKVHEMAKKQVLARLEAENQTKAEEQDRAQVKAKVAARAEAKAKEIADVQAVTVLVPKPSNASFVRKTAPVQPRVLLQLQHAADAISQELWQRAVELRKQGVSLAALYRHLSEAAPTDVVLDYDNEKLTVRRNKQVIFNAQPMQLQTVY